jgi:LacI family transcriptional regulator
MIEIVMGHSGDHWTDQVIVGAQRAATAVGCDLVLTMERDDPADDWPARIAARRSSGVVLGIIVPTAAQLAQLRQLTIPVVLLDPRSEPRGRLPSVGTTDAKGGSDAAAHLVACGYDTFVVLRNRPRYRFGRAREEGFRATIRELTGAEVTALDDPGDLGPLLRAGSGRIGLFAVMDSLALKALDVARSLGIDVPRELGVVGFDDDGPAEAAHLTTINQPIGAMAGRAVELARELRDSPTAASTTTGRIEFPTRLVVRGTTGLG